MGKTEQEVIELIVSLLESNITDPLNRNKKWIYDDRPRLDLTAYPRISVTSGQSLYELQGLGNTAQNEEFLIIIEVYVNKNSKIDVNSDLTDEYAEQIVDYLSKQVKDTIKDNRDYFITNDVCYVLPESSTRDVVDNLIYQNIVFRAASVN